MGTGTLCSCKMAPIYGHGDTLRNGPHKWACWPPCMGMGTPCTDEKAPKYGHVDTLQLQKGVHIWAWGHLALRP